MTAPLPDSLGEPKPQPTKRCPQCGGKLIAAEDLTTDGRFSRTDELSLVCEQGDWFADGWMGEDEDDPAVIAWQMNRG